ncbi:MAG: replication initiator protein A [Clostridia bacterium]|nr:replication initiator protein A [Clostridia bacterium]
MNYNFYAIFPLKMLTDERFENLSTHDFFLYMLLLNRANASKKNLKRFSDKKGVFVFYSNSRISKDIRCTQRTATRTLNNLEQAGLIRKEYQQRGLPLKIYVNDIRNESTYSIASAPKEKEVSFDVERALSQKQKNRRSFGDKKRRPS